MKENALALLLVPGRDLDVNSAVNGTRLYPGGIGSSVGKSVTTRMNIVGIYAEKT